MSPEQYERERLSRLVGNALATYLVGLAINIESDGNVVRCVYSGFLLEFRGVPLWVTAGHVLKEIERLRKSQGVRIRGACWLDGFDNAAAPSRPVSLDSLLHFEVDK